jgi:hypothetical protein
VQLLWRRGRRCLAGKAGIINDKLGKLSTSGSDDAYSISKLVMAAISLIAASILGVGRVTAMSTDPETESSQPSTASP